MKAFTYILALVVPTLTWAQSANISLHAPMSRIRAGSSIEVEIVNMNSGNVPVSFQAPASISALLFMGQRTWPVELNGEKAPPVDVAVGAFSSRSYRLTLPAAATGPLILELRDAQLPPARAVIEVIDSVRVNSGEDQTRDVRLAETASVVSSYARSFEDRLSAHEPIYFIYGGKAPAAKFQFSVKYRLLDLSDSEGRSIRSIQVGYTQRSLWDIDGPSSPFYDTSYMPETFFQSLRPISVSSDDGLMMIGYQTGIKHESNGREGSASRSLNTGFFRPFLALGSTEKWHLVITPEVFGYLGGLDENADLKNYRGYGHVRAALGYKNGPVLVYNGRAGKSLDHATTQLDFSVPIQAQRIGLKIYFLLQYFNGYGESLLRYSEKSESLRAGFSLVR